MALGGTEGREFFIYALIYSNKLAYLQLVTVLVYENSPLKSHEKDYLNQAFSKNLEKYVYYRIWFFSKISKENIKQLF